MPVIQPERNRCGSNIHCRAINACARRALGRRVRRAVHLNLQRILLRRKNHFAIAQKFDLTGKPAPKPFLRFRWSGDCPLYRYGAFAAFAPASAGLLLAKAMPCQQHAQNGPAFKEDLRAGLTLLHGKFGHCYAPQSTIPKKVTVFGPLIYLSSVSLVVLYTSMP